MANEMIQLLTDDERTQLPLIIHRRNKFRQIVRLCIENYQNTVSNCLMIQGKPGSGKTTLIEELLSQLKECGKIAEYRRVPGHITQSAMYSLLGATAEPVENCPRILLLDDVDALNDEGTLELLKAAFDTKSNLPTNRKVCYASSTVDKQGFKYKGFGIIITNDDFGARKISVHQQALLDRVQVMSVDLEPGDMTIYTTYLIEEMLNKNEDNWTAEEIQSVVDLFNNEIRTWIRTDAFRKANVHYSTRLIKKFVDAQRLFEDDWKIFNVFYQRLDTASQLVQSFEKKISDNELETKKGTIVRELFSVEDKKKGKVVEKLLWVNPATNQPFEPAMQTYYNRLKDLEQEASPTAKACSESDFADTPVECVG